MPLVGLLITFTQNLIANPAHVLSLVYLAFFLDIVTVPGSTKTRLLGFKIQLTDQPTGGQTNGRTNRLIQISQWSIRDSLGTIYHAPEAAGHFEN